MKITKFVHSCLMVEVENRTALFDPGEMSAQMLSAHSFEYLDDIIITHDHYDHCNLPIIQELLKKFSQARVTAPLSLVANLKESGVQASAEVSEGIELFEAPHEGHAPFISPPEAIGVHYLDRLSHPGDSHSFKETKAILALPVTAPWGSTDRAVELALELKPQYVVPIHDWHWRDEVRVQMYDRLEKLFADQNISFCKPTDGEPFNIKF